MKIFKDISIADVIFVLVISIFVFIFGGGDANSKVNKIIVFIFYFYILPYLIFLIIRLIGAIFYKDKSKSKKKTR